MGEARADCEPIDGRKGKNMTPRGISNAVRTGASHFISLRNPFLALTLACSGLHAQSSQVQTFPLSGAQDLEARNVKVESAEYKGRKAIRITLPDPPVPGPHLTFLRGVDFADGTIEADVAAKVTQITPPGLPKAPGFIGIAFRSRSDANHYELFYLRPGNAGSSDQLQRNHSVQYVAIPDFDWYKLRKSWPAVYETYVDLEPEAWTKMKIEVAGRQAKLYVNSAPRPVLVVDGLKGEDLTGGIGLWPGGGQENYFSNVRITHAKPQAVENGSDATGTWDIQYGPGRPSGSLTLHRDGATVSGTASGLLGTDVPVTGTWRNGYVEITFHGALPGPNSDPGGVTANLAGWIDGNSAKGRLTIVGRADDGTWTATRRE
jgi:hypothetical protein